MNYTTAVKRIEGLQKEEGKKIDPACRTVFLNNKKKTKRVIVFFHGITNCPYQFHDLGPIFYKKGYNVFVPRAPFHGYQDKLTIELKHLDTKTIIHYVDEMCEIAMGLGDEVIVMGLSAGGVMATYAAKKYPLKKAIAVAPAMSIPVLPWAVQKPLIAFGKMLKPLFVWWTEPLKFFAPPSAHELPPESKAYPRFSVHALFSFFDVGTSIISAITHTTPKAESFCLITNENDATTHPKVIEIIQENWGNYYGKKYEHHVIEKKYNLPHDFIDPTQPGSDHNMKIGYPILTNIVFEK